MCKCLHPPNIAGTWTLSKSCTVSHDYEAPDEDDEDVTDCSGVKVEGDITSPESVTGIVYVVKQNGLFVQFLKDGEELPRLGIWKPIYRKTCIVDWELILTENENSGTFLLQIVKYCDKTKCYPSELFFTHTKSGFEQMTINNSVQDDDCGVNYYTPTVSYGTFTKSSSSSSCSCGC